MNATRLVDHWRRVREGTTHLIRAVPPDAFAWRPHDGAFSCGDIVRHLMQAEEVFRNVLAAGARGDTWDPWQLTGTGEDRLRQARQAILEGASEGAAELGDSAESCLARWREVSAVTEQVLASVTDAQLSQEVQHPAMALRLQLWEMWLAMVEHEVHHRGQLSAYLKVLNVDQPALLVR